MSQRNNFQERRFSLREMTLKAEFEIYKCLPLHSQPAELSPRDEKPSRKISEPIEFVPRGSHSNNMQSLRSYQSQKYLQPNSKTGIEDSLNLQQKKFTINTISLKQLEPLRDKRPSLPKIKKRSPQNASPKNHLRKIELAWVTPEQMMAIKLQMKQKKLPKIAKEASKVTLDKRMGKKVFNTLKNEITGWNIQQNPPQDLYD